MKKKTIVVCVLLLSFFYCDAQNERKNSEIKFLFGTYIHNEHKSIIFKTDSTFVYVNEKDTFKGILKVEENIIKCNVLDSSCMLEFEYINMDSVCRIDKDNKTVFNKIIGYYSNSSLHYVQDDYSFSKEDKIFQREGSRKLFDKKGDLRLKVNFKNGIVDGKIREYFKGKCVVKGKVKDGKKRGVWRYKTIIFKKIVIYKKNGEVKIYNRAYYSPRRDLLIEYSEPF